PKFDIRKVRRHFTQTLDVKQMATTNLNKIIVVIATITALAVLVAAETGGVTNVVHDMGREKGWTYGFDYQGFINQYEVFVGDKLRFRYPPGEHDVVEVDEENFQKCTVPPGAKILTSGDDYIDITSPGNKKTSYRKTLRREDFIGCKELNDVFSTFM
nr:hypothetical protein [Tanacetum cinerariifolium]